MSNRLDKYKVKQRNPFLANFRCIYCQDSAVNKNKARGYIYTIKSNLSMKCFNCGKTASFHTFLKDLDPLEYKKFVYEKYRDKDSISKPKEEVEVAIPHQNLDILLGNEVYLGEPVKDLPSNHPAIRYLSDRKIPKDRYQDLFYVDSFQKLKDSFPKYEWDELPKDSRIVFPVRNRKSELVGISARAINKTKLRYVILKLREDDSMIFNIDKVDIGRTIYVTEGAIDSFFLPNSVAVDGADFQKLGELLPKHNVVIVFDDEARNKQIVQRMKNLAEQGYTMAIWPEWVRQYGKDINAMILNGLSNDKIIETINENTHKGLKLKLALAKWRK